jgi:hypothetical protein
MVMIMYVDGDLVPQSTTKMPREHNIAKRYFKFKEKSWRQSSKYRHHPILRRSSLHEFHASNDFLRMSLPCDTSLYLSDSKLQKFSRLINIKQKQHKQKRQKARKRHDIFDKISTLYKNSSFESSTSNKFISMPYKRATDPISLENLYLFNGLASWTKATKVQEVENGSVLAYDLFFGPSSVLYHRIYVNTGYKSR